MQRLKLSICPKGIETFDTVTGETLHKVSIYRISYCSADAVNTNVFAFIAGRRNAQEMHNNENDELTCYAFLCAKRKIAQNLTITVAKNFERAHDIWKKTEEKNKIKQHCNNQRLDVNKLHIKATDSNERNCIDNVSQNGARKSLLIDFNSDTLTPADDQRQFLKTAWVSFDDEPLLNEKDNNDATSMPGKIFENTLWDLNVMCS